MRRAVVLAVLITLGFAPPPSPAPAHTATRTLTGFENPESAPWDGPTGSFYVSNIGPGPIDPLGRDPDGYLSRISGEGRLVAAKWVTGLRSPKGIHRRGEDLLVADVGQLVIVDVAGARIRRTIDLESVGARFPNDVTVDERTGDAYVSDLLRNAIYRIPAGDGKPEVWLESEALEGPNGLCLEGDRLMVASSGAGAGGDGSSDRHGGRILSVELATRRVVPLPGMAPLGRLDGIEKLGSDWIVTGDDTVWRVTPDGEAAELTRITGAADLGLRPGDRIAAVPTLSENTVVLTRLP